MNAIRETESEMRGRRSFLTNSGRLLAGSAAAYLLKGEIAAAQDKSVSTKDAPATEIGFNVRDFGARGDGRTVDSEAINRAISAAVAAGGGTVLFPAGHYLSFSIRLASHVAIALQAGAVIIAADSGPLGGYDAAEVNEATRAYQDFGHSHWQNSLIWGDSLEDISILGPGLVWGRGLTDGLPRSQPPAERPGVGNKAIALKNCRNVLLRDFSILKGGHFGILATGVDNLTIDGVRVDTDRDGMDLDCCKNVRVSNCSVNSPDDAICPKSSYALGYPRATENLTITNCYVTAAYRVGSMLDGTWKKWGALERPGQNGGIKFGTESNGAFLNTTVSNCVFEECHGLSLETVDGARLEDMTIANLTMRNLISPPIFLRLGSRMRGPAGRKIGTLRRVFISDIIASNTASAHSSIISGIPGHNIEDVRLRNIFVEHMGGGKPPQNMPEQEQGYPEYSMFGASTPSQGLYARHVNNLLLSDVEIRTTSPDVRAIVVLDHVQGAMVRSLRANNEAKSPLLSITDVKDLSVMGVAGSEDVHFASIPGTRLI